MSIAVAVKHLLAAGVTGDALVAAIEEMEAAMATAKPASLGAERTRRWRERKASQNVTCDGVTSQASQASQNVTSDASREEYITTRAPALIPVGLSNDNPPIVNPLLVPQSETTAPRKASRAKPRTRIAENQIPTDADARHATERGLSKSEFLTEWRRFVDWHRAKGSTMADWQAAWRTWLGNRDRFAQPRAGPAREETSGVAKLLAEAYGFDRRNGNETAGNPSDFLALSVTHERVGVADHGDDGGVFGGLRRPDG